MRFHGQDRRHQPHSKSPAQRLLGRRCPTAHYCKSKGGIQVSEFSEIEDQTYVTLYVEQCPSVYLFYKIVYSQQSQSSKIAVEVVASASRLKTFKTSHLSNVVKKIREIDRVAAHLANPGNAVFAMFAKLPLQMWRRWLVVHPIEVLATKDNGRDKLTSVISRWCSQN